MLKGATWTVVREEELDRIRREAKAPIDVARPRDNNLGVLDDAPVGEVEVEAYAGIEPIVARVVGRTGRPEEEECEGLRVLQVARDRRSAPGGGRAGGHKLTEGRPASARSSTSVAPSTRHSTRHRIASRAAS